MPWCHSLISTDLEFPVPLLSGIKEAEEDDEDEDMSKYNIYILATPHSAKGHLPILKILNEILRLYRVL